MILKNKKLLLITSLLTLLPIPLGLVLWNRFPETMAIHFGLTGQADGFASPSYAVFVPPVIMLAVQWLCILVTAYDKGNKDRNRKMQSLVLWIIPVLSNLSSLGIYALALEAEFSPVAWAMIFMGVLFAVMGNYLPKTRMNSTMGIKIYWTYTSEENWDATHRFAGKLWVIGGILIALCFWLPHLWAVVVMFSTLAVMILVPVVYSRQYYKKELAQGKALKAPMAAMDKRAKRISIIALILLTAFILVVLFSGKIRFTYTENALLVQSNMYSDYTIRYETIDAVEFREGNVQGLRLGGFGSFRLLMGWFENEEFGTHIRYTYYKPEACVVLTAEGKTIVLSGETAADTRLLYDTLISKVG